MNNTIGKALAGHAARVGDKNNLKLAEKAKKYDNPLTDLVLLIIAEEKRKMNRKPIEQFSLGDNIETTDLRKSGIIVKIMPRKRVVILKDWVEIPFGTMVSFKGGL